MGKLTVVSARSAKAGRHADGAGLYLLVKPTGAKSWLLRVQVGGERRDIGLGGFSDLTLAEAREAAARLRKVARTGGDPIKERDKDRRPVPPFRKAADECHAELSKGWTDKYAAAFLASLKEHAVPSLGNIRVDHIEASTIRDALAPIWIEKPVIARKVRQRIGTVLNFAKSKGWRATEAPTRSVSVGLSRQPKGKNFAAMPYVEVPGFFTDTQGKVETVGRMALLFTIATAARSGEVRTALWSHIDLEAKVWRRPAELMKSREAHEVTLSPVAIEILERAAPLRATGADCLIFPGTRGKPISDMTLTKVMRDAGKAYTVHGFRSSFRDWAAEKMPSIPDPVAEAALAHAVPDKVVAAYKRTAFMQMRRELLDAWGRYAVGESNVVKLKEVG
ncbi:tyrosine-type recombinase/integrase [Sphingobium sp. YR768]|uniref:tyrosine-type recombinase/integrase n=1 Tax=Sphingobium sp. YR768 TaxID=1884365 RepID=UPI0008B28FF2|nr:site-specific integrase [Sphingobium sp. YR768]SEQ48297.1 Integrase [Sphingobium sp. YR768]